MIEALIQTHALFKLFYASMLAGAGVTVVFSLAILGATRWSEMRRAQRIGAATAYGVLAAVGLLLSSAVVVYGLILVGHKS